ncbi:organic cation transporter protein-like [Branchiostoma floridae]|uniref:Organic cation transporter protein-like n=1 Tax=Branchiostoma floridae TaxID=7739 RepID=A0A9J7KZI7_BRAFL|nr:organic cation transporter protein-like [Branchiostoma floridae]
MMEYDAILQYLGDFGPFQRRTALLLVLGSMQTGLHIAVMTFIGAIPIHHCRVTETGVSAYNTTWPDALNFSIPMEEVGGTWRLSSCRKYTREIISGNFTTMECPEDSKQGTTTTVGCKSGWDYRNRSTTGCTEGWEYDRSQYHSSVVMKYDLVCERAWLRELAQSMFMAGVATGGIVFGVLSDRYGRHRTLLVCVLLLVTCGTGLAFTSNLAVFIALRFVLGAAQNGLQYTTLVTGMETIGISWRMAFGICTALAPSVGYALLGSLAYVIREWWILQLAVTSPGVLSLIAWWFIPESPRWLLMNNRVEQWRKTIQRIAEYNGIDLPPFYEYVESSTVHIGSTEEVDGIPGDSKRNYNLIDLVRTQNMRKITVMITIASFNTICVYVGLLFGTSQLAGSHYVTFILGACVEAVAILLAGMTMRRWGRKRSAVGFSLLAGVSCAATAGVPNDLGHVATALATAGRFGVSSTVAVLDIYCTELFPTVVRYMGVGTNIMVSRAGGIVAPFLSLLGNAWRPLPLLTLGVLSCVTSVVVTVLPETHGVPLPNTLQDGENFGRTSPPSPTCKSNCAAGTIPKKTLVDGRIVYEDRAQYEWLELVTTV